MTSLLPALLTSEVSGDRGRGGALKPKGDSSWWCFYPPATSRRAPAPVGGWEAVSFSGRSSEVGPRSCPTSDGFLHPCHTRGIHFNPVAKLSLGFGDSRRPFSPISLVNISSSSIPQNQAFCAKEKAKWGPTSHYFK